MSELGSIRPMMLSDPDTDPVEEALERCEICLVVPTDCPDDSEIVDPFDTFEEAEIWSWSYQGAIVGVVRSPEFEAQSRLQWEEIEAWKRPSH